MGYPMQCISLLFSTNDTVRKIFDTFLREQITNFLEKMDLFFQIDTNNPIWENIHLRL